MGLGLFRKDRLNILLMSDPSSRKPAPENAPDSGAPYGCIAFVVAVFIILFAFGMGAWSAYRDIQEGKTPGYEEPMDVDLPPAVPEGTVPSQGY